MRVPMKVLEAPLPGRTGTPGAPAAWLPVFAAWLVAAVSTLGALFLSEVVGVPPCSLCWYQRVFMFPLAIVLAVGLFPLDPRVLRYAAPLAVGGWLVALYHVLLTMKIIPESMAPCTQGIPCSQETAVWFGFVTIPLLSLLSFTLIAIALAMARRRQ
jgi:disulfide bond formation protein DsbB